MNLVFRIECRNFNLQFWKVSKRKKLHGRDRPEERVPPKPPEQRVWRELEISTVLSLTQCPRTDLNKRFLPRPKTITAWKLIPHRPKISKNWNPPQMVPLHKFFKKRFYLHNNSFTVITFKLILLSKKVPNVLDFNSCLY